MSRTVSRVSLGILVVLTLAMPVGWVTMAGELDPPVPPGTPTMKPLNEIEPRRPIYAEMLPLTIDVDGSSWYLAESISVTGAGITISATNVTIDLMGFHLSGASGNGPGISSSGFWGVTIRNGSILGWDKGIKLWGSSLVEDVSVSFSLLSCIEAGDDSRVIDSTFYGCGQHGIVVNSGSIVRGCVAEANGENGIWSKYSDNGGIAMQGSLIVGNIVDGNVRNGIRVDGHATVLDNHIRHNDRTATEGKAGIWVYGEGNRIEGNHIAANNVGIDLDGNDNIIIKNTIVHSVTSAYDIAPATVGNVFEIGTDPTAGPWANFCKGAGCPP
jgi:parallel beta-helix repeat protein